MKIVLFRKWPHSLFSLAPAPIISLLFHFRRHYSHPSHAMHFLSLSLRHTRSIGAKMMQTMFLCYRFGGKPESMKRINRHGVNAQPFTHSPIISVYYKFMLERTNDPKKKNDQVLNLWLGIAFTKKMVIHNFTSIYIQLR